MKEDIYLSWAKEFSDLDLGDERLTKRFLTVLNDLSTHPPASIYESSSGEKSKLKAAYRLMDQEKLESKKVWSHHQQNTVERIKEHPEVLVISDTTIFSYENHLSTEGLGRIGKKIHGSTESQGLHCHTVLAVTPEKLPLGILDQNIFIRPPKRKGKNKYPGQVPYLEKESNKWGLGLMRGLRDTENLTTQLIAVSDRESDINAYLGCALDFGAEFIVRAKIARKEHKTFKYLTDFMKSKKIKGTFKLDVIKRTKATGYRRRPTERLRHAVYRTAHIKVRWEEVQIRVENINDESRLENLYCVYALEKNPDPGSDPIEWLLVTSLEVKTFKDAQKVIRHYSTRWIIEVFHKMLKSGGCKVEECCLQTRERLERYITMESLVAIKLTQLTYYQRCYPKASCRLVVDDLTWQTAYCMTKKIKTLPDCPPTAGEFTIMVAKLGGYLDRKSDPPPGGIILRRGWERLQDMKVAYEMFKH